MLECVINVSEGQDGPALRAIVAAAGDTLLDVHRDEHHNRAVITLAGDRVEVAAQEVARACVAVLDLSTHVGVHPRIGVIDVVPFVPLDRLDHRGCDPCSQCLRPVALGRTGRPVPSLRAGTLAPRPPQAGPRP